MRKFRAAAGISQERLAEIAGLNRTYLGDVERGERNISIVNMDKIAQALGVKLADIMAEAGRHLGR